MTVLIVWCKHVLFALFMLSNYIHLLQNCRYFSLENFLYVLQAYQVFPDVIARIAALVFPWIELGVGVFLALGLRLRPTVLVLACMSGSLIVVVGQAIIRRLPIDSCGCFGNLVHLPLRGVIFLDLTIFVSAMLFLRDRGAARRFSLDQRYDAASL